MRKVSLCTRAALMAAPLLLLTACSSEIQHGVIQSKQYIPASSHTEEQPVWGQSCSYNPSTKSTSCTQYIISYIPYTVQDPECYQFHLKDVKGHMGDVCVPQFEYQKLKVGDNY